MTTLAGEWSRKARAMAEPAGLLAFARVTPLGSSAIRFTLGSETAEVSSALVALKLKGCDFAALWAITLGRRFDEAMEKAAAQGEYLLMAGLDAAGSEMAEEATLFVFNLARAGAKTMGKVPSSRISPGYGDFPMEFHRPMSLLLGFEKISLFVLEGSWGLNPRKSVTAIAGLRG